MPDRYHHQPPGPLPRQGNYRVRPGANSQTSSERSSSRARPVQASSLEGGSSWQRAYLKASSPRPNDRVIQERMSGNYYQSDNLRSAYRKSQKVKTSPRRRRSLYHRLFLEQKAAQASRPKGSLPQGRWALAGTYLLLYAIMLWMGWLILPFNWVNHIAVSGNQSISDQAIIFASGILPFDDRETIKDQKLEIAEAITSQLILIDQVEIESESWQGIQIHVQENRIVGRINESISPIHVLSNGDTIRVTEAEAYQVDLDRLPEIINWDGGALELIGQALAYIPDEVLYQMIQIQPSPHPHKPQSIEVLMADGNLIQANAASFWQKMQLYPQIVSKLEGKIGVINMEVGIYYTPYDDSHNSIKLDNSLDNS